ncbi:hypothetical protein BWQ96_06916 [Gracilariopsis chorda]|uniref:BAR domain-containing protein n=1 Tax=Gracilariopsis chorda TaxID=448386 RepID=A0A2V3IMQ5_9FLOR|nr:hypothetical protein BWQ96_06916 [Gracilariopsis chorda]|eukprot:PXF43353.1 hypothetical protein BWQ96_06916 [Gracilariopsis chorda]
MAGIKHATKKKFAKSTTRKKTIQSGISAEFTNLRKQLSSVGTAVKSLIANIGTARDSWLAISKEQTNFAETIYAAVSTEGEVRSHAKEVQAALHQLQQKLLATEGANSPHRKVTAVLDGYLKNVQDVEADGSHVQDSYSEVLRYQKKVDRLQKKPGKRQSQLQRNLEKLTVARNAYQAKLDENVARMKEVFEKHEVVLQCAHHAFWIAQQGYFTAVDEVTREVRWESVSVQERVMDVDINRNAKLALIPRALAIMPPVTASEVGSSVAGSSPSAKVPRITAASSVKSVGEGKKEESDKKDGVDTEVATTPQCTPKKAPESEPVTPEVKPVETH